MTIFRSPAGPVISTRRSWRSAGHGRDAPVALAHGAGRLEEVGELARLDPLLPLGPRAAGAPPAGRRTRAASATTRSSASGVRTPASSGARTVSRRRCVAHATRRHLELRLLGRALERERRALAAGDRLEHRVEVAGADLALVARRRVAVLLVRELRLLEPHVRAHPLRARSRARGRTSSCRPRGSRRASRTGTCSPSPPSSRWNDAIVVSSRCFFQLNDGEQLYARSLPGNCACTASANCGGLVEVGRRGLAPEEVGVRRVRERAGDRRLDSRRDAEEALGRALAGDELAVALVDVAREQRRRERVGARDEDRRDVEDVGGEPRGDERADELARRHEHLAAEVAALLLRRELVLEVDARGAGLDERLHQLERVQRAAEAGLGVGDDRREPVRAVPALRRVDLVGAEQGVVDALRRARARCSPGRGSGRGTCARRGSRRRRPASRRGRSPAGRPSPSARPARRSARRARRRTAPSAAAARAARRRAARACARCGSARGCRSTSVCRVRPLDARPAARSSLPRSSHRSSSPLDCVQFLPDSDPRIHDQTASNPVLPLWIHTRPFGSENVRDWIPERLWYDRPTGSRLGAWFSTASSSGSCSSLVGLFVVVVRGFALWRQGKRTGKRDHERARARSRSAPRARSSSSPRPSARRPDLAGRDRAPARLTRAAAGPARLARARAAARTRWLRVVPPRAMTRVAAVDLGTNSTRLLVADVDGDVLEEVARRLTITRLGEGVDERRRLLPVPIARVRNCLADYRRELEALGAERTLAIATSAVRDAENGEAFLGEIEWSYGFTTRLLAGDEEAAMMIRGVTAGRPPLDDVARRRHRRRLDRARARARTARSRSSTSLDVGCVRLTERFLASDPPVATGARGGGSVRALAPARPRGATRDRRRRDGDDARDARPRRRRVRPGAHARAPDPARVRRGAARAARGDDDARSGSRCRESSRAARR